MISDEVTYLPESELQQAVNCALETSVNITLCALKSILVSNYSIKMCHWFKEKKQKFIVLCGKICELPIFKGEKNAPISSLQTFCYYSKYLRPL